MNARFLDQHGMAPLHICAWCLPRLRVGTHGICPRHNYAQLREIAPSLAEGEYRAWLTRRRATLVGSLWRRVGNAGAREIDALLMRTPHAFVPDAWRTQV